FFSGRRRHTRLQGDWSSDVCSSDLVTTSGSRKICYPLGSSALPDVVTTCLVAIGAIIPAVISPVFYRGLFPKFTRIADSSLPGSTANNAKKSLAPFARRSSSFHFRAKNHAAPEVPNSPMPAQAIQVLSGNCAG